MVGILPELYSYSTVSYIGCGFGKGVHNVIEPAVYNNLICFGPNYFILNEAIEMVENELAFVINTSEDLVDFLNKINDDIYITNKSNEITSYIKSKEKSAQKIVNEILQL